MEKILEATLGRIAVISDQFLGGSCIGATIIFAWSLSLPEPGQPYGHHRLILTYIAVGLVLVGFAVYIYARFKGVSSEQEMAFQKHSKDVLDDHKQKKKRQHRNRKS